MDRRLPLIPCLLALVCAAPARADGVAAPAARWPAGGSTLAAATALGAERWGMAPCGGRVALSWARLDPGVNAQSSWANDRDPYRQPSFNEECAIALSSAAEWDWPKLCSVVVHEVGHLTGHDHVDNPADVMYPGYVAPVRECALTPEPAETGAPAAAQPQPRAAAQPAVKARAKKAKKPAPRRRAPARRRHR